MIIFKYEFNIINSAHFKIVMVCNLDDKVLIDVINQ